MRKLIKIVSLDKSRLSGNGSFPAPKKSDIGRNVIITRTCVTWDGCLGYFIDDKTEKHYAFYLDELSKEEEIPEKN